MAEVCLSSLHLCRFRVTRLDALGNVVVAANNSYVTDNAISLGVTPDIETGPETVLRSGCDEIKAQRKSDDLLKRFNLQLDLLSIDPELVEMLTGASVITDGGVVVGTSTTYATNPPLVAVEAWSDAWEDDHQYDFFPYIHWVWTAAKWQIGPSTLENDFASPQLNAFTRGNPNFGLGPYGDLPEAIDDFASFYTDTRPAAHCGYLTAPTT